MKKAILIFAGIFVLAAVFAVTGFAYAQTQTPPSGDTSARSGLGDDGAQRAWDDARLRLRTDA